MCTCSENDSRLRPLILNVNNGTKTNIPLNKIADGDISNDVLRKGNLFLDSGDGSGKVVYKKEEKIRIDYTETGYCWVYATGYDENGQPTEVQIPGRKVLLANGKYGCMDYSPYNYIWTEFT